MVYYGACAATAGRHLTSLISTLTLVCSTQGACVRACLRMRAHVLLFIGPDPYPICSSPALHPCAPERGGAAAVGPLSG